MSDKKFTVRPEIEVELTRQDIDDIMCAALEGWYLLLVPQG